MRSTARWRPWVDGACRALLSLAPPAARGQWARDVRTTVAEVCLAARRDRGRLALMWTAASELLNLAWTVGSLRLGVEPRITEGLLAADAHRETTMRTRFGHDLRLAVRGLLGGRMTTVIAAATMALGVGISTAVFSVLDAVLWRPVPYHDAARLTQLWAWSEQGRFTFRGRTSSRAVVAWRGQTDLFDRVEASESRSFIYEDAAGSDMVDGTLVTPGLLPMLGVTPSAGRLFADGDGRDGTDHHVIVSDRFWREHLHRNPAVIGSQISLNGSPYDVVGVLPASFRYPDADEAFWIPYDVTAPPSGAPRESLVPLARARVGVPTADVTRQVIARGKTLASAAGDSGDFSARTMPIGQTFDERTERSLQVLGGAVFFLLLIVCANVASLVLSRALPRARDAAIRMALGASRADVLRETLYEHLLLGAIGAGGGVLVAELVLSATVAVLPEQMTHDSLHAIGLDGRALVCLLGATLVSVLACGLPAAFSAARSAVAATLQRDSRGSAGSAASRRFRSVLVVVEVGLSIVLLVGAALMTRSLLRLQSIDIGLDPDRLVTMQVGLPKPAYSDPVAREMFTTDLLARLRLTPGVTGATAGDLPPRQTMVAFGSMEFGDRTERTPDSSMFAVFGAWPDYFRAAGIRVLEGHTFETGDPDGAAVVSEGFAKKYWPDRSAIGARFRVGNGAWRTIVGVVSEVRRRSDRSELDTSQVYYPHDHVTDVARVTRPTSTIAEYRTLIVRVASIDAAMTRLPQVVHEVDPRVVVAETRPVERVFADDIARPRVVFMMMAIFAVFGLVLAAAGLYGVLSCLVAQRLREIGIRLALGARPADVGRLVLGSGLRLTIVGVMAGVAVALGLVRVMRTLLYEVEPSDPVSVTLVAGLLLVVAIAASWVPARKAMRVDPVALLRE